MAVEVIRFIRAAGGDFDSISAWMDSYAPFGGFLNLTDPVRLVRAFDYTGADLLLPNELVTNTSGAQAEIRGTLKDNQIVLRILSGTFSNGDTVTSSSGSVVLTSAPDQVILVCELYGDWSNGLDDNISLRIFGNMQTYPAFRVEPDSRHRGQIKSTPGIFYLAPTSGAGFHDASFAKGYALLKDIAVEVANGNGFIVETNKTFINPMVYGASNGVASFADIGPGSVLINAQTTTTSPIGFQLRPNGGNNTYLFNCSDWHSLTSFQVADIVGTTSANLINCAGLSETQGLPCFIGNFTNPANSNNASRDGSAPGSAASFNVSPVLEDESTFLKHLSYTDTALNDRGANLTNNVIFPFNYDYDYEVRPELTGWTIGPDQVMTNPNVIMYGGAVLDATIASGAMWTETHGGGGATLASIIPTDWQGINGQGYVDTAVGEGFGFLPMTPTNILPFGIPKPIIGGGEGNIIGDGQGFTTLYGSRIRGGGVGHVAPIGSGGATLGTIYGGYVSGIGGIKLRTNIIGGGDAGYEMINVTDNSLFGAIQYRDDFEPKFGAPNYAGGNIWEAPEHWLPIPTQYLEAILAYISYKILMQDGMNNSLGRADFFLKRYEHACKLLEKEGTTTTKTNTPDIIKRTETGDW